MQPVESGAIAELGHDPASNTLRVKFKNGGVYEYHNVTAEKHQALMGSDSIGKHFAAHIRQNHEFRKLS